MEGSGSGTLLTNFSFSIAVCSYHTIVAKYLSLLLIESDKKFSITQPTIDLTLTVTHTKRDIGGFSLFALNVKTLKLGRLSLKHETNPR
jgi:hypothetical protein